MKVLFEVETLDGKPMTVQTIFSRFELDFNNPIKEYLPEKHYNTIEVWYCIPNEIDTNCIIGEHHKIKPNKIKYIGD